MPKMDVAILLVLVFIVGFFVGYWRWGRDVKPGEKAKQYLCLNCGFERESDCAPCIRCGALSYFLDTVCKDLQNLFPNEDAVVATLREAREAASHDSTEPLYSHRAWRSMLRAALYYVDRYNDMIYQVGKIYPGETRFQTAMRYLRQAEEPTNNIGCAATPVTHLANAISDNAEMT